MAKFFDTSYGNDECPSEGAVTRDKLYRIFYCEDNPDYPEVYSKYTIWSVDRGDLSKEDATDAVFDFSDAWVDELETDSDEEFQAYRQRIASLKGLRGLGSAYRQKSWEEMTYEEREDAASEARGVYAEVGRRISHEEALECARRQWQKGRVADETAEEIQYAYATTHPISLTKARAMKAKFGGFLGRAKKLRRGPRPGMTEVHELELFADNTEPLYRRKRDIEAMLVRKLAAGKYDRKKAVKAYRHYADAAAKMYLREFVWGRGQAPRGRGSYGIFSVKEREALAKREERQFFARVKSRDSELLDMVPKKYRKSGQTCEVRRTNGTFKLDCNIDLRGMSRRRKRRR